jgi:DNA-binding PucR family transcriptional regulator
MSSPKAARSTRRPKAAASKSAAAQPARQSAPKAAPKLAAVASSSETANNLAAELERALADGKFDVITPQALQALTAALCKIYSAQVEAGADLLPVAPRSLNSTDVMVAASGLLKSSNLAVFELGMWQSWSGR